MPVKNGDEVLGIIFVANKSSGEFTDRDEELLTLFAAHAAIALTNARLYERSRELSVLEERARLARELHDAVSQRLFSIRAYTRAAEMLIAKDPARAAAELSAIAELGAQAHGELRAVIDGLAPPRARRPGRVAAPVRAAGRAGARHPRPADRGRRARPGRRGRRRRRSGSRRRRCTTRCGTPARSEVSVTLSRTRRRVVLEFADNGTGFDPRSPRPGSG